MPFKSSCTEYRKQTVNKSLKHMHLCQIDPYHKLNALKQLNFKAKCHVTAPSSLQLRQTSYSQKPEAGQELIYT
jgi:hypothetical protein